MTSTPLATAALLRSSRRQASRHRLSGGCVISNASDLNEATPSLATALTPSITLDLALPMVSEDHEARSPKRIRGSRKA